MRVQQYFHHALAPALFAAASLLSTASFAQTVNAPIAAGTNPSAIAINPITNKIYVTNETSDNVTVIDGRTRTATTVAVGKRPLWVAVNPETNKVYVSNFGNTNV